MTEALKERVEKSKTSLFKVVFPNSTNHYDTLFGGTAMYLMDEVAFITATRFSRKRMVTISSNKINFHEPIPADTIIELRGKVVRVGNTSLDVEVEIFQEEMYEDQRKRSIKGLFTFVAIDENRKPVKVI
jgi:acyl-CoA hydrolase